MDLVWQHGPCTAEQIRERLAPDRLLKDSSVRTVLRRLVNKGFLTHSVVGRTYLYAAVVEPGRAAAQAVRRIVDRFCGGSVEQLLIGMVDDAVVGDGELKEIAEKIAAAKGGRKR